METKKENSGGKENIKRKTEIRKEWFKEKARQGGEENIKPFYNIKIDRQTRILTYRVALHK